MWIDNLFEISRSIADIAIVWIVIHYLLKVFRNNARTMQIMKGIIYVFIAKIIADFFQLPTFNMVLNFLVNWGFLAVIVIFQPEIRGLLEKMGQGSNRSSLSQLSITQKEHLINEIVQAVFAMSSTQTGALITIQKSISLEDYIKNATVLNSNLTKELLTSIFVTSTPLHDGAVIVTGDRIACASAYFPPTNQEIPSRFGARHRAAVGISEITDSITVVVSEETGTISIAQNGKLTLMDSMETLYEFLYSGLGFEEVLNENDWMSFFRRNRESNFEDVSSKSMSELQRKSKALKEEDPMKLPRKKGDKNE